MTSLHIPIQHWLTSKGVPVLFVQRHEVTMVEMSIIFRAGSSQDGDQFGVSQLTNIMLNQGTQHYDVDQIALGFEEVGAQYQANSDRDMAMMSMRSLSAQKFLNPALDLFTEVVGKPVFPANAFERLQKMVRNAILFQQQKPESIAKNAFFSKVYHGHPYAHSVLGTMESVSALTTTRLKNFYNTYYVAKNAVITLVGDLSRQNAEKITNQISRHLQSGEAAPKPPTASPLLESAKYKLPYPSAQTHFLIGQVGVSYDDANYFPMLVGNYVLGGSPLMSRLFQQIREKNGLAYSIASTVSALSAKGPFVIVFQTRNSEAEKALKLTNVELKRFIAKGPTPQELTTVKKNIINGYPATIARNADIANHLQVIGFYQLPLTYLEDYCERIRAISAKQIKDAYQQQLGKIITIMTGDFG